MADGEVVIDTSLDPSGFEQGLGKLGALTTKGLSATATAITAVSAALSACATYCVKVGSDFEAGMSQVEAISSASSKTVITATGEMLDGFSALNEKAKEMGATTKFSATESAQALSYMAMAGWEPQEMYDGLAGVMMLAAASGQDLATTSDILTDALTAFGMEANESGHFADILAHVSASANTNVGLLGETFKYVAPLCGTLGYSAEDASIAIGLMANSGIKGSQAGTALKTALANLAAPTKSMAAQMDALGISLQNTDGTSKSLMDVMVDLRSSFGELSSSEQAAAASAIFGKEAMSGMLAVINASDEDFADLTKAIYGCDGAAEQMAATMQDNLQGQLTILKSGVEGLGIAVYEKLQIPLKNLAIKGQEYIGQLTAAFNEGGFSGLVAEIGNVLADVVTEVVKFAPQMLDAATSVIQSFIGGISGAIPQVSSAIVAVGVSLVEGVLTVAPDLLSAGIELIVALVNGVSEASPELLSAFVGAVADIASTLLAHIPELLQAGINLMQAVVRGVMESLPQVATAATTIISQFGTTLTASTPNLITSGLAIVKSLAQFLVTNLPLITQAAISIIEQLAQSLIDGIPDLMDSVIQIMNGILGFVVDNLPAIVQSAVQIITQLCTSLVSLIPQLVPVVTNIIMSFFNFVVQNLPMIVQAAIQVMTTLVTGIIDMIPCKRQISRRGELKTTGCHYDSLLSLINIR